MTETTPMAEFPATTLPFAFVLTTVLQDLPHVVEHLLLEWRFVSPGIPESP
jgi:hypothetical protein